MNEMGRLLILLGLGCVAIGIVLVLAGKLPWLGRLPGDFYYQGERLAVYLPLATSIVISAALSLLLYLFRK